MSRHCHLRFWLAAIVLSVVCWFSAASVAQTPVSSPSSPTSAPSEKMTPQTRIQVIRSLQAERVFARVLFPQGDKGLKIKDGKISPSEMAIAQQIADYGAAVKPGDRCVITDIKIKDKEIILEINGGTKKRQKWYQHIQISGGGAATSIPGGPSPQSLDAHGSSVTLVFDKYVPEVSGDDVRAMLAPVFDFKALTGTEAYQKTLPPKLQAAIRDHQVLVGMDKEMVMYSKGRPQQRIRDKDDKGEDYEEWIYGKPPEEVEFVRFKGNEVARLEIMSVDGKKIVRTEREVDLPAPGSEVAETKPAPKPQAAPTLRRPGEQVEYPTSTSTQRVPNSQDPQGQSSDPNTTGKVPTATPPINPNPGTPHLAPAS
jgi:hypothetical protein